MYILMSWTVYAPLQRSGGEKCFYYYNEEEKWSCGWMSSFHRTSLSRCGINPLVCPETLWVFGFPA